MRNPAAAIEDRLGRLEPRLEVLLVERAGPERLRVFIDHPDGVDLALCERVTGQLSDLLAEYALEVSSPGIERPLTKPEHFRRYLGRRIRVKTREAVEGKRNFSGTLTGADERTVSLESGDGPVTIPHERIHRSNLVPETGGAG